MGAAGVNGVIPPSVTQDHMEYTSTRSTFLMTVAGKVSMNVTFLSPLTPDDLRRQSVIGSYLYVSVKSLDGATHAVQLYCDTSAGRFISSRYRALLTENTEWTSIHKSDTAQWKSVFVAHNDCVITSANSRIAIPSTMASVPIEVGDKIKVNSMLITQMIKLTGATGFGPPKLLVECPTNQAQT